MHAVCEPVAGASALGVRALVSRLVCVCCSDGSFLPFPFPAGGCFGAVVVKNGKIVGEGYNNVISRNDPTW